MILTNPWTLKRIDEDRIEAINHGHEINFHWNYAGISEMRCALLAIYRASVLT